MEEAQLIELFSSLNYWKKGSERAPHKPLLTLLALGEFARGNHIIEFSEIEERLTRLLNDFGPYRKSNHPEYPFWYLRNDGIWIVDNAENLQPRKASKQPTLGELRRKNATGHFPEEVIVLFDNNPALIGQVSQIMLNEHWPESQHRAILQSVGLETQSQIQSIKKTRDPNFRKNVLDAYQHRCAICGFECSLDGYSTGLEAAHIQWHCYGGPDIVQNGLALCALHHDLFDRGILTIGADKEYNVLVSEKAKGSKMFEQTVLDFHGTPITPPVNSNYYPDSTYLSWNYAEVFKQPERQK